MCVCWDYIHQNAALETRMESVLGLVALLAASSHGLDSICDATQNSTCYGALGGPVYLQLMKNPTGHEVRFSLGGHSIFTFRRSQTVFYKEYNTSSVLQRWQFVPDNGTLIINPAERRDSGTYRVLTFDTVGRVLGDYKVHLIIEALVSDVDLSVSCSANGKRWAVCSSNGDSAQFSWSLDVWRLSEADADLSSDNQTLLLRGNVTGEITCSVRNHVSSTHTSALLCGSCCGGVSPVFISVWLAEIIILTSLLVGGYYLYTRNKTSHSPDEREYQNVELTQTSMTHRTPHWLSHSVCGTESLEA